MRENRRKKKQNRENTEKKPNQTSTALALTREAEASTRAAVALNEALEWPPPPWNMQVLTEELPCMHSEMRLPVVVSTPPAQMSMKMLQNKAMPPSHFFGRKQYSSVRRMVGMPAKASP